MSGAAQLFAQLQSDDAALADKCVSDVMRVLEQHANDPDPNRFVALVAAARHRPALFSVARPGGITCVRWLGRSGAALHKNGNALALLACALLQRTYADERAWPWPVDFLQCYLEDSFGVRLWCDDSCGAVRLFVANLLSFFTAHRRFGGDDAAQRAQIVQFVVDQARFVLEHEPANVAAAIRTLTQLALVRPVRELAARHLRTWLRDAATAPHARLLAVALVRHCDDADQLQLTLVPVLHSLNDAALLAEPSLDAALRHAVAHSRSAALLALDAAVAGHAPALLLARAVEALGAGAEALLAHRLAHIAVAFCDDDAAAAGDDDDELLLRLARGRRQLYSLLAAVVGVELDVVALCDALLEEGATLATSPRRHFVDTLARCVTWALLLRAHASGGGSAQLRLAVAQVQTRAIAWCHKDAQAHEREPGVLTALVRRVLFVLPGDSGVYFPDASLGAAAQSAALAAVTDGVPLREPTLVHLIVMRLTRLPLAADDVVSAVEAMAARAVALAPASDDERALASCEQLVDGLLNVCRLPRPASLSGDATAPCHAPLLWRVINVLLLIGARHASSAGSYLWRSVPSVSCAMRAVLTQRWPTTSDEPGDLRAFATAQLLDEASVVDEAAIGERVAQLRAGGCVAFERDSTRLVPPSEPLRRHTLQLAGSLRVAERLARCRAPDFVLEAAAADEALAVGSAAPWLSRLLRTSDALVESVSPACRCAVLLHLCDASGNGDADDEQELRRTVVVSLRALLQQRDESPLPTIEVLSFFLTRLSAPTALARDVAFDCLCELLGGAADLTRLPWYSAEPVRRVICDALLAALRVETWLDRIEAHCAALVQTELDRPALVDAVTKTLAARNRRKQSAPVDLDKFKEKRQQREQKKKAEPEAVAAVAVDVEEKKPKRKLVVEKQETKKKSKIEDDEDEDDVVDGFDGEEEDDDDDVEGDAESSSSLSIGDVRNEFEALQSKIELGLANDEKKKKAKASKTKESSEYDESSVPDLQPAVVYVGHVPFGFHERQLEAFFGQFGEVTRVKLARSKRTGGSRHFAFVEFRRLHVAKVVVEAMNGYLIYRRRLVCAIVPPEKCHAHMWHKSRDIVKTRGDRRALSQLTYGASIVDEAKSAKAEKRRQRADAKREEKLKAILN